MTKSSPPPVERAFTLIEILVVIAIIIGLAAILVPSLNSALERAKATKDMSNLRQIGIAMQTLLNDSDQVLPPSTTWPGPSPAPSPAPTPGLYPKYIATIKVFQSPFDKRTSNTAPVSYSINHNMYGMAAVSGNMLKVVSPASTFFMAPNYPTSPGDPANNGSWPGTMTNAPDLPVGGVGETTGTHNKGRQINVLFCDWHTESVTFGPSSTAGTFQNTATHWDPTQ